MTTAEARRNTFVNPSLPINSSYWAQTFQSSGTSTGTRMTDGDLVIPETGQVVTRYYRQAWTAVTTGGLSSTGVIFGSPSADAIVLTPGIPNTVSVYARQTVALGTRTVQLVITSHKSDGTNQFVELVSAQTDIRGTGWTRLSGTFTPAEGQVRGYTRVYNSGGVLHSVGDTLDVTAALVEPKPSAGYYFDGDTPDTADLVYDWTGVVGNSPSTESWPVAPEPEPETYGSMGPWLLPDDRHFYTILDPSPFAHSGELPEDVPGVLLIQAKVGAEPTGLYDSRTMSAVRAWRKNHGADDEEFVDYRLWRYMDQQDDYVDTPVGAQ